MRRLLLSCLLPAVLVGCPEPASDGPPGGDPEPTAPEPSAPGPQTPEPLDSYDTPSAPVSIVTDDLGVPHVYGQTDLDAFYGAGYQQAVDHLWAIDVSRRAAVGRLAEIFGEDRLSGDVQARTLDFAGVGAKSLALMRAERPHDHNLVVAFVGGINRRIAEVRAGEADMPPEYAAYNAMPEPLAITDPMAIGMRIHFGFSSTLDFDLLYTVLGSLAPRAADLSIFRPVGDAFIVAEAAPDAGPRRRRNPRAVRIEPTDAALAQFADALVQYRRDLNVGEGSNGWVISGEHTANGRPILANDSHAGLQDPNVMDLLHIDSASAGGAFNAMGMSFMGVPGVHVGHNADLVWGATTNFADLLDLWDVNVNAEGALIGEDRVAVQSRTEVILVRQDDGPPREEALEVRWIPGRGIFVPESMLPFPRALVANGELMLAWPGMDGLTDLFAFFDMDRAATVDDFEAAIRQMHAGMQNWMGASANGWRYLSHGDVPDRGPLGERPEAYQVLDAADANTLWTGAILPDAQLPYLDGSQPYMSSANNDPWGHTADDDPLNDAFYYASFFAPGFRALRLKEALPAQIDAGGITVQQTQQLQMEVDNQMAARMLPGLMLAIDAIPTDPDLADWRDRPDLLEAAAELAGWDTRATTGSKPAALFKIWWEVLARNMLLDDMGPLYEAIAEEQPIYLGKFVLLALELEEEELLDGSPAVLMVQALDQALALLTADGPRPVWGDLHRARLRRPDNSTRDLVTGGDGTTLNVAQSRCLDGDALRDVCSSRVGSVYRMVTDFDDSGRPVMRFNCPACRPDGDQDWIDGEYRRLRFTPEEVEANTVSTVILNP